MKRVPATACLLLLLLPVPRALAQCSPNQDDFGVQNPTWAPASLTSLHVEWEAWPGATSATTYDVYVASAGQYCVPDSGPPTTKIATVSGLSTTVSLPAETVSRIAVVPTGCATPSRQIFWDTFAAPLAKPTRITATPGASSVSIQMTYADTHAAGILAERLSPDGSLLQSPLEHSERYLCPPGQTFTLTDDGNEHTGLAPGLYRYRLGVGNDRAVTSCGPPTDKDNCDVDFGKVVFSDPIFVVVGAQCPAPAAAPVLTGPADGPLAGRDALFSWTSVALADGRYLVETSRDASFSRIETSLRSSATTALVPTPASGSDFTLYVRVRAVQGCGTPGPVSNPVSLPVRASPAALSVTAPSVSWTAVVGGAPPTATIGVKNVGGSVAHATVGVHGAFFDANPTGFDLEPGASTSVTLTVRASALAAPGSFAERLEIDQTNTNHVDIPVTLTVVPAGSGSGGPKLSASTSSVVFSAPTGQEPQAQTITVTATTASPSRTPIYLTASVGPGGSWLELPAGFAGPVSPGGSLDLSLSVKRGQRSAFDGPAPLRTLLTIVPFGGAITDGVVIEVIDVEPTPVTSGSGRTIRPHPAPLIAPPGGTSFIVPSAVSAGGAGGAFFVSDGWLRNDGSSPFTANLFYTPDSKNGLTDPDVVATTVVVPPGGTHRLSALVSSLFQRTGSGEVEVRAAAGSTALLPAISLRTTVESVTAGDATSRYGTEMPTVSFGAGAGRGDGELVLTGIDDDSARRANLILAETSGAEATVAIRVTDGGGTDLGPPISKTVPPYGKIQVNRLVTAVKAGAALTGGSAGVTVTAGGGRVVAVATIIDNASNSFSAVAGRVTPQGTPAAGGAERPSPLDGADSTRALVIPSVARLPGAFSTQFITSLSITNGTGAPANLTLTYFYNDLDAGGAKTVTKSVTLPARGSLPKSLGADVIVNLLGVTNRSFGWIRMTGDVTRVVAVSAVSAQVDPNDTSKGFKTAQVDGFLDDSPDLMAAAEPERRFAGSEKSVQRRTNLILVETAGATANATIRAYGPTGEVLASKTVSVAPNQYFQINDVFGDSGLALGAGPFQNVPIGVAVTSSDGNARLVGLLTINDNISRNPEIFVLRLSGAPPPTIGF